MRASIERMNPSLSCLGSEVGLWIVKARKHGPSTPGAWLGSGGSLKLWKISKGLTGLSQYVFKKFHATCLAGKLCSSASIFLGTTFSRMGKFEKAKARRAISH
jgi:hypothetical protein